MKEQAVIAQLARSVFQYSSYSSFSSFQPVLDQSPIYKHDGSMYGLIKFVLTRRRGYMSTVRKVSRFALFFLVMAVATTAVAAEKATPSGKVTMESTSIAAGIGVTWGDGKLTFKGKTYPFSIDGLTLVDWGISKAQANGDVYNLTDPAKLGGTYLAAEAGLTLAGGMGGMVLRNQDNVVLHLRSVSQGARLQLGTSGLIIKMK
jgi:Envelope integrity protein A